MRPAFSLLDRYVLRQVAGTLFSVFAIVISLMLFEHLPKLFDIVRLSGRKGYIVAQSMLALLPEYAGVGLLFGLYMAVALTVRRLSLRGELDIIQASGVSGRRWLRFPALFALLVAALLVWNQGWLMPGGEQRLAELGQRMEDGSFGFDLEPGKFTDLGNGVTVRFEAVDRATNQLSGVFFRTPDTTFSASRGRLGFDFGNHVLVDLADGHMVSADNRQSLTFAHFHFDSGGRQAGEGDAASASARRKGMTVAQLLASGDPGDRAAAWSRLLWPAFALMIPLLAAVLGKPQRRTSSSLGLMAGLILLVVFTRSASFVGTAGAAHPEAVAAAVAGAWLAATALLLWAERRLGGGFVDGWLLRAAGRLKVRRVARRIGLAVAGRRPGAVIGAA